MGPLIQYFWGVSKFSLDVYGLNVGEEEVCGKLRRSHL